MYNINYSSYRSGYRTYGMFFVLGTMFVLVFLWTMFEGLITKFKMDGNVEAYNVEIDDNFGNTKVDEVVYHYVVDGIEYSYEFRPEKSVDVSKAKDKKTIYYESSDPSVCIPEIATTIKGELFFVVLFAAIFPVIGVMGISGTKNRIQDLKWLAKNGTLIKGINYKLVESSVKVNNKRLMAIQVDYMLPSGNTIKLQGEPIYDGKRYDEDGLVDLLIDLNNPSNYHLDFCITEVN